MNPRAAILAFVLGVASCGGKGAGSGSKASGIVRISAAPPEAEVWIDDRFVGTVGELPGGVRVPVGTHRVELRHDDFHTRYDTIEVRDDQIVGVEGEMAEDLR